MSAVTGFSSQQKQDNKVSSFDSSETRDTSQFNTLQRNYSDKVGADSVQNGVWKVNNGILTIASAADSSKRLLNIVGHGAKKYDMLRFKDDSSLEGFESQIIKIIDANNLVIATVPPQDPTIGDEVDVLRAVTLRLGPDGTIQVSVAPTPIQFVKDGVNTEVEEDSIDPSQSNPLPVKQLARFVESAVIQANADNIDDTTGQALITTTAYCSEIEIINSTGYPLVLEIDGQPGPFVGTQGLLRQAIAIPTGKAIVVKTVQAITADAGIVAINTFA